MHPRVPHLAHTDRLPSQFQISLGRKSHRKKRVLYFEMFVDNNNAYTIHRMKRCLIELPYKRSWAQCKSPSALFEAPQACSSYPYCYQWCQLPYWSTKLFKSSVKLRLWIITITISMEAFRQLFFWLLLPFVSNDVLKIKDVVDGLQWNRSMKSAGMFWWILK